LPEADQSRYYERAMNTELPQTRTTLTAAFRDAGIAASDSLIVHSAYRSFGAVEGGPTTVIEALLAAIGPSGNLMLPTFNYSRPLPEPFYDGNDTPCRTGIIPELGRKRPDAIRSLHPTHSVAAIGPDAGKLTERHLEGRAFGIGSPIDRLAQTGGKVLLLGVGQTSNSTIHIAEEHAGIPKVPPGDPPPRAKVRLPDGRVMEHEIDSSISCSAGFEAAAHILRRRGHIRDTRLGGCLIQSMCGSDVIDDLVSLLREQPDALLCTNSKCDSCVGVRRQLTRTGRRNE
jgi:aminoglycoside 3-N-acetyltransferase